MDKKEYITKKLAAGEAFDPDAAPAAPISVYPWGGDFRPECRAVLAADYGARCLRVFLEAKEPTANCRAVVTESDGNVCQDSCLEFFFCPEPEKGLGYINFEANSLGTLLVGVHNGEVDGQPGGFDPADFSMRACRRYTPGGNLTWSVTYDVPFSFIQRYFPGFSPAPGHVITGNFYKCGDLCPAPHYAAWAPLEYGHPSFHRPEQFAKIVI